MHHAKNRGNKEAILSRILAQSCIALHTLFRQRVAHDYDSILDSFAKGLLVSTIFRMVHPYIHIHSIVTLVYL